MKTLAILGASGHGKVAEDIALLSGWDSVIFFDDSWPVVKENFRRPVEGTGDQLLDQLNSYDGVFIAIGNNVVRLAKLHQFSNAGAVLSSLIHPTAVLSSSCRIGSGCFVGAGVIIQADSVIADGCIINTSAVVEHDCVIGDAVHISPNAALAGGVSVGAQSWIGIGAAIRQLVSIGPSATVGAGAIVVKDVSASTVVVGNPARPII